MKAYDSVDIDLSSIISRSKDLRVADTHGGYLVNKVKLKDGSIGYVWSKNQKFDESKQIKESMSDITKKISNYIQTSKVFTPNLLNDNSTEEDIEYYADKIQQALKIHDYDFNFIISTLKGYYGINESKQFNLMNIVKKVMRENTKS